MKILECLRRRDPGFTALRRSVRAAIVVPGLFALGVQVMDNTVIPLFGAFGAIGMLLFVEFGGPMRERLAAQTALIAAGGAGIVLGTLASREIWLSTLGMAVIGFLILFSGVVSSSLAGASTTLLVSFILPATLPGGPGAIPDRLAGWGLAGAASLLAIGFLWRTPVREPLRVAAADACGALAVRLRAEVDCVLGGFTTADRSALGTVGPRADEAVESLRTSFFATPYRPTGLSTAARTLVRLVDEVLWLKTVLDRMPLDERAGPADGVVCEVKMAAADLLETGAELLAAADDRSSAGLEPALRRLTEARTAMERTVTSFRPRPEDGVAAPAHTGAERREAATGFVSSLEPSFRAQEMSFAVSAIASNIELVLAARRRTLWQRFSGRRPEGVLAPLASVQERAGSHAERHSVWLHNSVRGAISLALAVLVAELTGVQHSFWVVFGTMAVLRSSALLTGQSSLRAVAGTTVGFVIGGGLIELIGSETTVLWFLLPLAVLFTGLAPAAISFAAGQAGFTMSILILFDIIQPAGWSVGIVRIEDVAIGCAVSVVVGVLFWPRGAGAALGLALAEAFSESARYVRSAVGYGVTRCDRLVPTAPLPEEDRYRAAAAARRLDDAFRGYLAERGAKHVSLKDVSALMTAVAVLRLTADAVLDVWGREGGGAPEDRTAARAEIDRAGDAVVAWYGEAASAFAGFGEVPDPEAKDAEADVRLIRAVERDLGSGGSQWSPTAIRVVWTADHIEAVQRLEHSVLEPARIIARLQRERTPHRGRFLPYRRPHADRAL